MNREPSVKKEQKTPVNINKQDEKKAVSQYHRFLFMICKNVNKTLTFTWYNICMNGGIKYVSDIGSGG